MFNIAFTEKNKSTLTDRQYRIVSIVLILIAFAVMVVFSEKESFWFDELFNIGLFGRASDFKTALKGLLTYETTNPPLYTMLLFFWCRFVPYREVFLLLITEVSVCIGIYACGETQRKLFGNDSGLITVILGVTSMILFKKIAWELRSYAFLFMFTSLFLLSEISIRKYTKKSAVLQILLIACLLYTHYFGGLFMAVWSFVKLVHCIRRKIKDYRWIVVYAIGAACFLPWMTAVMIFNTHDMSFWPAVPDFLDFGKLLFCLCSYNYLVLFCVFLGCIYVLIDCIRTRNTDECNEGTEFLMRNLMTFGLTAAAVFIFSRYIAPWMSLWVKRYFFCFMPCILMTAAHGIHMSLHPVNRKLPLAALYLGLAISTYVSLSRATSEKPYREAAAFVAAEEKGEDTVLYSNEFSKVLKGFQDFYLPDNVHAKNHRFFMEDQPESFWILELEFDIPEDMMSYIEEHYDLVCWDRFTTLKKYRRK